MLHAAAPTSPTSFTGAASAAGSPASGPSASASSTAAEEVGRWFDVLLGTPLQILVTIVVGGIVLVLVRMIITRTVDSVVNGSPRLRRKAAALAERTGRPLVEPAVAARRVQRARTMGSVLRSTATLVIGVVVLFIVLDLVGVNIGPLIASAGIAGVALGFGAQTLVKDFLSGLFLLIEDQYGVGDVVDLGEVSGTVEAVGLRVTQVRSLDGTLWYVRNGELLQVGNMTQGWSRALIEVRVGLEADVAEAMEAMRRAGQAVADDPELGPLVLEPPTVTGVEDLNAEGALLRILVKTAPAQQWGVARALRQQIRATFTEAGVPFALTRRELVIERPTDDEAGEDAQAQTAKG